MTTTIHTKRKRRLLRFSVRTFLVAVTLLAIWLGVQTTKAKQQKAALDRIAALGGSVRFSFQHDASGRFDSNSEPSGPQWLRALLGSEYFDSIVYVGLQNTEVTDDDLQTIACLNEVETLWLVDTSISDTGLKHLARLGNLKHLYLAGTEVGDDGLSHLSSLHQLEGVTLNNTRITDLGLAHLRHLRRLVSLNVPGTEVSGNGLQHLHNLPRLEYLNLSRTNVSNSCLNVLGKSTTAWWIDLRYTHVSDDGIDKLVNVPSLKKIEITRDQAHPDTIEKLRRELAACQVVIYESPMVAEPAESAPNNGHRLRRVESQPTEVDAPG